MTRLAHALRAWSAVLSSTKIPCSAESDFVALDVYVLVAVHNHVYIHARVRIHVHVHLISMPRSRHASRIWMEHRG